MYYEVHGRTDGVPLVLLHGGGSTIEVTFSRVLPVFAGSRRVIAVEEQGRGRSTDSRLPIIAIRGRSIANFCLRRPGQHFYMAVR